MGRVCGVRKEVIVKIMYLLVANILLSQTAKRSTSCSWLHGVQVRVPFAHATTSASSRRRYVCVRTEYSFRDTRTFAYRSHLQCNLFCGAYCIYTVHVCMYSLWVNMYILHVHCTYIIMLLHVFYVHTATAAWHAVKYCRYMYVHECFAFFS